jgi:hypothetical protein
MLWTFHNPKNYTYLKSHFKHLKNIIKKNFMIFFIWLITSWFEIENGKKKLLSISFKYSYFKPFFNYTQKGLWKGILIHQNWATLVCFHLASFAMWLKKFDEEK